MMLAHKPVAFGHRVSLPMRRPAGCGRRASRGVTLPCNAALSPALETAVGTVEKIQDTLPKVEKVLVASSTEIYSATTPAREEAVRSFKPIIDAIAKFTARQASGPAVQSAISSAQSAATDTFAGVGTALKPAASVLLNPEFAVAAAAGVGLLVLTRLLLLLSGGGRRYKADIRPAEALDAVLLNGAILIDIRSQADVSAKGNPTFPGGVGKQIKRVPLEDDLPERRQLRDSKEVQRARLTLRISNLQGISTGTRLILLDANGRDAPSIANALSSGGFTNVSVISGGFAAWLDNKLPSKAAFQVFGIDAGQGFFPTLPQRRPITAKTVDVEVVPSLPATRLLPAPKAKPPPPKATFVKPTGRTVTVTATAVQKPSPTAAPKKPSSTVVVTGKPSVKKPSVLSGTRSSVPGTTRKTVNGSKK